ncbi:MAG: hypothetical protein ASARMPREDX12_009030 [Alectoria sarmentosa]|nr:MAG: hypothetical protein ASARMPREDX12_009030 [Alectoria sarmentosa]
MARSKKAAGLGENLVMTPWRADEEYICPSLPELESHQCSYLAMSRLVVQSCLSSHVVLESSDALELAIAIKAVTGRHHNVQVLWKSNSAATGEVRALLRSDLGNIGRVRIESWLEPDPTSLMESGHSWIRFGIPQIVLPSWCDNYDFVNRVEYLGIDMWANKTVAPNVRADELSRAMTAVLEDDKSGERRRARARELGEVCGKAGGRKKACAKKLELIEREPIET